MQVEIINSIAANLVYCYLYAEYLFNKALNIFC